MQFDSTETELLAQAAGYSAEGRGQWKRTVGVGVGVFRVAPFNREL